MPPYSEEYNVNFMPDIHEDPAGSPQGLQKGDTTWVQTSKKKRSPSF
jgi:hypothetical protein